MCVVKASRIESSVSEISIKSSGNEEVCSYIEIYSDYDYLVVEARWSEIPSKNLINFKYSSNDFGIIEKFPKKISGSGGKNKICFIFKNSYMYNGVLLFYPEKGNVGIGIWIKVNDGGKISVPVSSMKVTHENEVNIFSEKISLNEEEVSDNFRFNFYYIAVFEIFIGLLVFAFVMFLYKRDVIRKRNMV
jgi:hypothetical protein